jgi:hypothetical protein
VADVTTEEVRAPRPEVLHRADAADREDDLDQSVEIETNTEEKAFPAHGPYIGQMMTARCAVGSGMASTTVRRRKSLHCEIASVPCGRFRTNAIMLQESARETLRSEHERRSKVEIVED